MLKNKIIVRKIRNILILLMAIIIMIGAYKNIGDSRAEDVIEIYAIAMDNYGYLSNEPFKIEATQIEDEKYEVELPENVNGKQINQIVKVTLGELVSIIENENGVPEIASTENTLETIGTEDASKEEVEKHLDKTIIPISAKENTGIIDLEETIKEMFFHGEVSFNDEVYITNIRQKNSLQDALDSLNLVVQSIEDDMPEDFYSIDLMSAYESLGKMIGESVEDDLVNEIFSKFCMGK